MNLQSALTEHLWMAVETNYSSKTYTGAILDAVYFLSNLIREKTGLESDGVSLVAQAFGGTLPKLKVNKLQTESERNIQKGMQQLLTGVYQAIRNPRSHEKYADTESDAETIILFINYLVNVIDRSRSPFTKTKFLERIFDPHFVENERYARLIAKEVPIKQRLDVLVDVWRRKKKGVGKKLRFFVAALFPLLTKDERIQMFEIISDDLETLQDDDEILLSLQSAPDEFWLKYSEAARLRIESRLITSAQTGRFDSKLKRCKSGALGTWLPRVVHPSLKLQLGKMLAGKLASGESEEEEYVFQFFFHRLPSLYPSPPLGLRKVIVDGLKAGNLRFYEELTPLIEGNETWKNTFQAERSHFKSRDEPDADEIPF